MNNTPFRWAFAAMLGIVVARVPAQTCYWTNATAGVHLWSTAANWTNAVPPDGGGAAHFLIVRASGASNVATNDFPTTPFVLNGLHHMQGTVRMIGAPLRFVNNGATLPVLTNSTGSAQAASNNLVIAANLGLGGNTAASALAMHGAVDLGGASRTLTSSSSGANRTVAVFTGPMGNGGLIKAGGGSLTLSGANTYALGTLVNGGTLQFDSSASIGGAGANVTNSGGAIAINFPGFAGAMGRMSLLASGSLAISASNATEAVDFSSALFTNTHLAACGTITNNLGLHTPNVNFAATGSNIWRLGGGDGTLVVTNPITGGDCVTIGGGGLYGIVKLANSNSYTGFTTVQNGTYLSVATNNTTLGRSSMIVMNNGTLQLAGIVVTSRVTFLSGGASTMANGAAIRFTAGYNDEMLGPIVIGSADPGFKVNTGSGSGIHIIRGGIVATNRTVALYDDVGNNPIVITNNPIILGAGSLNGHNVHIGVPGNVVGGLNIDWGNRLVLTVDNAFVGAPSLSIGGTGSTSLNYVEMNGHDLTVRSLRATNQTATLAHNCSIGSPTAATFTLTNGPGAYSMYQGYFSGAVSFVKSGAGTFTLSGTNRHTGTTTVLGGTLIVTAPEGVSNSAVSVNGGTLLLGTPGAVGAASTLAVGPGGAVGSTNPIDQAFVTAIQAKIGANPTAFALGASSSAALNLGGSPAAFLGASSISNMVFNGSAAWGDTTVRLGGGGGSLIYLPSIGAGSNLLVGPVGGDAASVVVLLNPGSSHDGGTVIQSGSLRIPADAVLGAVPGAFAPANVTISGGSLWAVSNSFALNANRGITMGAGGGEIGVESSRTLTIPGAIAGAGFLSKTGAGTLGLLGVNTYVGPTTNLAGSILVGGSSVFSGGTLFMNGGSLGVTGGGWTLPNAVTLLAAATVDTSGGDLTFGGPVTGPRLLVKNGANVLTLSGNTSVSNFGVNAGTARNFGTMVLGGGGNDGLQINNNTLMTNAGVIRYTSGKVQLQQYGRLDNTGQITNSTALVLSEGASTGHTVANNFPGGSIHMQGGTFYVGLYYTGTFNNVGGSLTLGGGANVLIGGPSWTTTVGSNTLGTLNVDSGYVEHAGSGSFQLGGNAGSPNGTGAVNLNGGVLAINKGISRGTGPAALGYVNFNGGTLSGTVNNVTLLGTGLSGVSNLAGGATIGLGAGITNTISAALLDGGGSLTKLGQGMLRLTGANAYSGATRLGDGTLGIGADGNLGTPPAVPTAGHLVITGGTLAASAGFTLHANRGLVLGPAAGAGSATVDVVAAATVLYGGSIADNGAGSGSLVKAGAGALDLSGASTFGGGTIVDAGTLLVNNTSGSGLGSGPLTVGALGTLGGTGAIAGAVTVTAGGRFAPGNSVGTNTVGSLTLTPGSTFEVEADGAAVDQTISLGPVDLGGATLSTVALSAPTFTSALILSNATGQITGRFAGLFEADQVLIGGVPYFIHYRPTYVELNLTPTAVVLHQFGAIAEGAGVVVRWRTASESGTAGFFVYRKANGAWVKVNDTMVAATGAPQGGIGASYALADPGAAPGGTYEYKLVEVVQDGAEREYGPYERTATAFELTSPIRATPGGMEIRWLSRDGERYRVLRTTDLRDPTPETIGRNIDATPPENVLVDTNAAPLRVYRIEMEE